MKLKDFKLDINKKKILTDWLDEFFHSKNNKTKKFTVIYGRSGNGKTALVQALAETYNVDLYRITAYDLIGSCNFNNCVKSLNLEKIDGKKSKIVLFEDFYEIRYFRGRIIELLESNICKFPIIITMDRYPNEDTLRTGLCLELGKPLTSELVELLRKKQKELGFNYSDDILRKIAIESYSVRSAFNSLFTGDTIKRNNPNPSLFDLYNQLLQRRLQQDIRFVSNKPYLITTIVNRMNCYTDEGLKILHRFTIFDHSVRVKYLSIDKFLVNNMKEPIENLKLMKNTNTKQIKKKSKKIKQQIKKEEPKNQTQHTSLADFGL